MLNIVGLLIIIALSVITTLFGASMDDDTLILTNTLNLHVINIIYSLLVIGFICDGQGGRILKTLATIAFVVIFIYLSSFVYTVISYEEPKQLYNEFIND